MLILFDIDGTLLVTEGAGRAAMMDAGRELFGEGFTLDGIEIAGRLDPLIWADAAAMCGIDEPQAHHERFRATYGKKLRERLDNEPTARLLPGVAALVDALEGEVGITLGLLTGNYPETGRLKVERAGLDPDRFTVAAWGCDGTHRRDLPAVAIEMCRSAHGRAVSGSDVLVIGDTPHDVDCARHHGCRCLAVATGQYSVEELRSHGPDRAVQDLTATSELSQWIINGVSG